MYRIIEGLLINTKFTSIEFRKVSDPLVSPSVEINDNTRTMSILYNEGHLNNDVNFEGISVIEPDIEISIEGIFNTFNDEVILNGIRYYRLTPESPLNLTQLLVDSYFGDTRIERRDSTIFIIINENDIGMDFEEYKSLISQSGLLYVELVDPNLYKLANFNFVDMLGKVNKNPISQKIVRKFEEITIDEPLIVSSFIEYIESNMQSYKFMVKNEEDTVKLSEAEYITYDARMEDANESYHLVTGPNFDRMYYSKIRVDFKYHTQDISRLMEFRRMYLMHKNISSLSTFYIPLKYGDEEGKIFYGIFWDRNNVTDSIFEESMDSDKGINLYTFSFFAYITGPIIIGAKQFMESISEYEYNVIAAQTDELLHTTN